MILSAQPPASVEAVVRLTQLPGYISYFLSFIKAGSLMWYASETVVGSPVLPVDARTYPVLHDAEEIWFVFDEKDE